MADHGTGLAVSACKIVGASKPNVWHDGDQWQCDQTTQCLTCGSIDMKRLADDDATWAQALCSSAQALPLPSQTKERGHG